MYRSGSSATAAATTGPARQPRPTSSTPATRLNPSRRMVFSSVLKARTLTTGEWPERSDRLLLGRVLHPCGFALQLAQEVQLRAANARRAHDVDLVDDRRVQWEDALDPLAERHLGHGKRRARAAPVHPDYHALEHLDAFLVPLADLHVNANGVARLDRRALHHIPALDGLYGSHLSISLCKAYTCSSSASSSASSEACSSKSGRHSNVRART